MKKQINSFVSKLRKSVKEVDKKFRGRSTKKCYFPHFWQWKQLGRVLTKKEKLLLLLFGLLFLGSACFLATTSYFNCTEIKPTMGGKYSEGVVGRPRFINPIYASASDVDRDLTELVFSGLMKYDIQGKLIPDLAQEYQIKEEGKIFEVRLRENIFWHDNERFTPEDVIFTIKTIQNPDYKSPLRADWLGVKVEKIDDQRLRFELSSPYSSFLERLTLKILPQHIWKEISPENFSLSAYNLRPIGTGPYRFKNLKQDEYGVVLSLGLERFKDYFGKKPYLNQIDFFFFEDQAKLIASVLAGEIEGFSFPYQVLNANAEPVIKARFDEYSFSLPRYFSVFLNPEGSEFLKTPEVRQALNYAVNKQEIIDQILLGKGTIVSSPVLPEIYGYETASIDYQFNPQKAGELLEKAGFEKREGRFVKVIKKYAVEFKSRLQSGSQGEEVKALQECLSRDPAIYPEGTISGHFGSATKKALIKFQEKYAEEILKPWGYKQGTGVAGDTTRAKLNEVCGSGEEEVRSLKFSLITVEDPLLKQTAELLKKQWGEAGIELEIKTLPISQLEYDVIKTRKYECLLFGELLGLIPDPYPFWHSSQKKDPGFNLSKYENEKVDALLVKARTTLDSELRQQSYQELQEIILKEAPAVFLYSPDYIYFVSKEIKGVKSGLIAEPAERFIGITDWYTAVKRQWK